MRGGSWIGWHFGGRDAGAGVGLLGRWRIGGEKRSGRIVRCRTRARGTVAVVSFARALVLSGRCWTYVAWCEEWEGEHVARKCA